jgi:hypothetical protein
VSATFRKKREARKKRLFQERRRRINKRLGKPPGPERPVPMMTAANIQYELADRVQGLSVGGIGGMLLLARRIGLISDIEAKLQLLNIHLPYHESDHVLNIAFNILAGGQRIEHLELRRDVYVDKAATFCRQAGFRKILMRGDTEFAQTKHLDRWDDAGDIRFIFGYERHVSLEARADELPPNAYKPLERPQQHQIKTTPREKTERVKQEIVRERRISDDLINTIAGWLARANRGLELIHRVDVDDGLLSVAADSVHGCYSG